MPTRPMDPAVKRARVEGKKFLRNVTGLDVCAATMAGEVWIRTSAVFILDSGWPLYVGIDLRMDVSEYGDEAPQ
jgi:hypothetical protein